MNAKTTNKQPRLIAVIVLFALAIGSLAVVFASLAGGGAGDGTSARDGVVLIAGSYADPATGEQVFGFGSGFAIGSIGRDPEYFVTGYRVIENALNHQGLVQIVYSAAPGDASAAQVVKLIPDKDLALLRIPAPTGKRKALPLRRSSGVKAGERVYALGYSAASTITKEIPALGPQDISIATGGIGQRSLLAASTTEAYETDIVLSGGYSGGPLVDGGGSVVGVNAYVAPGAEAVGHAVIIDQLLPSLREMKIAHAVPGGATWVTYAFAALAALLAGGGVWMLRGRLRPAAYHDDEAAWAFLDEATASSRQDDETASSPQDVKTLLYHRDDETASPHQREKARAPEPRKTPVLQGVTGSYAGQRFPLDCGRVTLGRDSARCDIVFKSDTPGVSGAHCSVQYDDERQRFVLIDLGSSYGTFLSSGQRLTPSQPAYLDDGDGFYLATQSIGFTVRLE